MALLYGGYRAIEGDLTIGVLTAFLLYLRMFFEPMQDISQFYNTFQSASAALEKISGVLEERPTVREPERPVALPRPRGHLRLDRVQFRYVQNRPVLPDLSVDIRAGQTVALVGTTDRRGQDHHRQADGPLLRSDRGHGHPGRGAADAAG